MTNSEVPRIPDQSERLRELVGQLQGGLMLDLSAAMVARDSLAAQLQIERQKTAKTQRCNGAPISDEEIGALIEKHGPLHASSENEAWTDTTAIAKLCRAVERIARERERASGTTA